MKNTKELKFDYSIVIPAYNEEVNVVPLMKRIVKTMAPLSRTYEVIIVDNGSYDSTPVVLNKLIKEYKELVVLTLTRNFGYDGAIVAGFENARGRRIIVMDGDQQDPPEILPRFIAKSEEGYDVVYGIRSKRTETWLISKQIKIFYKLLNKIVNFNLPEDAGNFGVMTREVVEIINRMPERNKFIRGLRAWTGYTSEGIVYQRDEREHGKSKFSYFSYFNHALNGISSFSNLPLRLFTYLGIVGIVVSCLGGLFILATKVLEILGYKLLPYSIASGFTTISFLVLVAISFNALGFGILGEYLGRIFEEVKKRPSYLIKDISRGDDE